MFVLAFLCGTPLVNVNVNTIFVTHIDVEPIVLRSTS